MARKRRVRLQLEDVSVQAERYEIGIEVGAEKYRKVRRLAAVDWKSVADQLTSVRAKARECAKSLGWPTARWAHAIALANRAWKLAEIGAPDSQYEAEVRATIVALGLSEQDANKLLECLRKKGVNVKPLGRRR